VRPARSTLTALLPLHGAVDRVVDRQVLLGRRWATILTGYLVLANGPGRHVVDRLAGCTTAATGTATSRR